jgi:hypothetical protein
MRPSQHEECEDQRGDDEGEEHGVRIPRPARLELEQMRLGRAAALVLLERLLAEQLRDVLADGGVPRGRTRLERAFGDERGRALDLLAVVRGERPERQHRRLVAAVQRQKRRDGDRPRGDPARAQRRGERLHRVVRPPGEENLQRVSSAVHHHASADVDEMHFPHYGIALPPPKQNGAACAAPFSWNA